MPAKDLAEFVQQGGTVEDLLAAVEAAPVFTPVEVITAPAPGRWRFLSVADLANQPPTAWQIDGLLPRGALACVYGPSGAGKSFAALDWALSIASGGAWLDHQIDQAGKVIYIAAEGVSGMPARVHSWLEMHPSRQADNFYVLPEAVNMMDPHSPHDMIVHLPEGAEQPALIIIDTLARCMVGGDENSSRDMGLFIANADMLRKETGATVLIVHHTGKSGNGERGSSALRAACDTMIALDASDGLITVECDKQKDAAPFEPFRLVLTPVADSCVLVPASDNMIAGASGALTPAQRRVLEELSSDMLTGGATAAELRTATQLPDHTIYRALKGLLSRDYITADGPPKAPGRRYNTTPAGVAAASIGLTSTNKPLTVSPVSGSATVTEPLTTTNTLRRSVSGSELVSAGGSAGKTPVEASQDPTPPDKPCVQCGQQDWRYHRVTRQHQCRKCAYFFAPAEVPNENSV